jgi:chemotaxis-related protein WspB
MLFVIFQLSRDRYALDAREIVEVLPLVSLRRVPSAPPGLAGLLDYRGEPVPVVDLALLALGRPSAPRLSTRIVIVETKEYVRFAMIAEFVTQTLRLEPREFSELPLRVEGAPYLGPVAHTPSGMVQWITPGKLLTPKLKAALAELAFEKAL